MSRADVSERLRKWEQLEDLQEVFPYTIEGLLSFAQVCLDELIPSKPTLNRNQADILSFMFSGGLLSMVQAMRGQAKTTLAGILCAFVLIHTPSYRVVVFSQTGKRAREIAGWVIKIFNNLDFLEFMLPDKQEGDKSSQTEGFDINGLLKGASKEPSISCYSIESGAQGARADIIIADDIESLQNSRSAAGRAWLLEQALEFGSINQYGKILYLGTPQSVDSIYNTLPSRGYVIRVWTSRYPTKEELASYGDSLAPMLVRDIQENPSLQTGGGLDGTRGQPTCPEMYPEEVLIRKEIDFGKAKYDLQFMLNTRLTDNERYPLKLSDLVVAAFNNKQGMVMPVHTTNPTCIVNTRNRVGSKQSDVLYRLAPKEYEWRDWDYKVMSIDPAGGGSNGDETAYSIVYVLGNFLYLYDIGGVAGGYGKDGMKTLVQKAKNAGVHEVVIESNYGNGALYAAIKPYFDSEYPVSIEESYSSGQKELRIIDSIEPITSSNRLVIRDTIVDSDAESIKKYSIEKQKLYSFFFQMCHLTRDRGCLGHDDRIDSLAIAVSRCVTKVAFDQQTVEDERTKQERIEWLKVMRDPKRRREWCKRDATNLRITHGNVFNDRW